MMGSTSLRLALATGSAFAALCAVPAAAQTAPGGQTTQPAATPTGADVAPDQSQPEENSREVLVTGSRIRQDPNNSALPLQIITTQDLERNSISSPEQLISFLTDNGSASDNLASNSDVVTTERRGNNGASYANLRGQGSAATLVLLNSRRVAAQGTTGAAVDVNQIPFMAIDRVEVLKDGASAIYGTDAVGGVINFITKKNYTGFGATGYSDVTSQGDAPIYRLSGIVGIGDLDRQGFNVMATVGYSWISPLEAHSRGFVNTFQHDRGLGVDTRGTPFATIVNLAGTSFPATSAFPFVQGSTTQRATGGLNLLRIPGGPGCNVIADEDIYDTQVWGAPGNAYACSFDTGKNVYLQQQLKTLTYYGRATKRFGDHEIALEITGSKADSVKRFSPVQITPNTSTQNYAYRLVPGVNDAAFNNIIARLKAAFPTDANIQALNPATASFSYRWRCLECGEREIATTTTTFRAALSAQGPLGFGDFDYSVGAQYADSISASTLGQGYYYQAKLVAALNSGAVNPFLFPGQSQSAQGLAAIQSASAFGLKLYGGKYSVKQADASVSGSLFRLPGGTVKVAAGVDYRRETYTFNGDPRSAAVQAANAVIAAPYDNGNALNGVHRDIKAAYIELLIPVFKGFELSAAGRIDDYTGFGTTKNPKISAKYRPIDWLMFRGSYNTAFRVPSFNQIFNPQFDTVYTGSDFADPKNCPGGKVDPTNPACLSLNAVNGSTVNIRNGGNPALGPETANEFTGGVVFEPSRHFTASADYWSIHRKNTIQVLPLQFLFQNYGAFQDRFLRDGTGKLTTVVQVYENAGDTNTDGIDITVRGYIDAFGGKLSGGIDGTYLTKKNEKVNASAVTLQELGVYSLSSDLGLRWKHNAFISYSTDSWSLSLTQIYRDGYKNQVLPGVAPVGTFVPSDVVYDVKPYIIYNLSLAYTGLKGLKLTAGVKNLFDTDPPFAISYDSVNGSGSSWEPRVADPRGRSFTMQAEIKF